MSFSVQDLLSAIADHPDVETGEVVIQAGTDMVAGGLYTIISVDPTESGIVIEVGEDA